MAEETTEKRTEISSLGEFGLVDHITKNLPIVNPSTIKAVGDDAAVIDLSKEGVTVISTDTLVEGIHFDLMYNPLKHLGYNVDLWIVNVAFVY